MNQKGNVDVFSQLSVIRKGISIIFRNRELPYWQWRRWSRRRSCWRRGRGWRKRTCAKIYSKVAWDVRDATKVMNEPQLGH